MKNHVKKIIFLRPSIGPPLKNTFKVHTFISFNPVNYSITLIKFKLVNPYLILSSSRDYESFALDSLLNFGCSWMDLEPLNALSFLEEWFISANKTLSLPLILLFIEVTWFPA